MADENKELSIIGVDDEGMPTVREPIKLTLSSYKKAKYLDIRKFYEKDGALHPTQKGITISTEESFLKILEMLNNHKAEIVEWIKNNKE